MVVDYNEVCQPGQEVYDYARCQRPDGTFYGTSGTCRKGTPVGPKEKAALKKAAKAGNKKAGVALAVVEGKMTKAQAKKALGAKAGEPKPKGKEKPKPETKPKPKKESSLQSQYSSLAKRAQKAMADGDMDKALKLNQQAMAVASKMEKQESKTSTKAKKKPAKEDESSRKTGVEEAAKQRERLKDKKGRQEVEEEFRDIIREQDRRAAPPPPEKNISKRAEDTIFKYTLDENQGGPDFRAMNGCSRNPPSCSEADTKANKALDSALKQAPANTSGGAYFRGINLTSNPELASQLESLKPGDTFSDPGFGSYSRDPAQARGFLRESRDANARNFIFESTSKKIRAIEEYSDFASEEEGVLPRGTSQRVTGVRHVGNTTYITVQ